VNQKFLIVANIKAEVESLVKILKVLGFQNVIDPKKEMIDVAFIDYFLVDGSDSLEIIKSLKEINSDVRLVIMSYYDIATVAKANGAGFLQKPFSLESVRQALLDSIKIK